MLRLVSIVLILLGGLLAIGGVWLVALGGSWYYLAASIAVIASSVLLLKGRAAGLVVYAALVFATLLWALWESDLDWWPLAARGGLLFVVGVLMLTPWVATGFGTAAPYVTRYRVILATALLLFAAVGAAAVFFDADGTSGTLALATEQDTQTKDGGVPPGEWHAYGRTGYGQRYSPLAQITPSNVAKLEVAWQYRTGDMRGQPGDPQETTFEVTPLKIGNRLFLCTPHQFVIALDATTGAELWRFNPKIQGQLALQHLTCRGLSYQAPIVQTQRYSGVPNISPSRANERMLPSGASLPVASTNAGSRSTCAGKLFMPTADGRLIALNPEDGSLCTSFGGGMGQISLWANMPNPNPGAYYSTSPVVVTKNLVIVGGTVLDNVSTREQSGVIRAFDVDTGKLVWNWDSANPQATQPIAPGQKYTANSPNSWSISSVDESLGMVYVPMGNQPPDQWGGNRSPEVERYSSAVVALDLASGKVRWSFQTVRHDLWDYDVPAQPSLVDLTIDGVRVPALVQATKQGEIFVLDRRTGSPLVPVSEKPAPQGAAKGDFTALTQPRSALSYDPPTLQGRDMWGATMLDQLYCRIALKRLRYEGRYTPPSTTGSLIYPGNFGVFNWGGVAVDPVRQIAITTPTYLAFVSRLIPRQDDTTPLVQGKNKPEGNLPLLNENLGAPFAVELSPFTSFLGIPCQKPPWGYISGADLRSGEIVWKHKNGTVRDSSPLPLPFKMGVPNLGGPLTTAGGVAFLTGTLDYFVRAYDVSNGAQLWEQRLPAGGQATPMTYAGADGRQYLLVVAGGHGSLGTKKGDYVIAYALPAR